MIGMHLSPRHVTTLCSVSKKNENTIIFLPLIVDEAHYIKNPEAKRTLETVEICTHADNILFMTGTALENNVEEMIRLMQIRRPSFCGSTRGLSCL